MDDILELIKQTQTADEYGDPVITEEAREVFCGVESIGQSEFYQAAATGLKPEIKFKLADYLDYNGETIVEHNGQRFKILRTYRSGQELELVCYTEVNQQ